MKYFLFFLAIFLIAFFQTTVVNFNFLLLLVLLSAVSFSGEMALLMAFLAGLFLDLFSGGPPGLSSLGLLTPSFLIILYSRRFSLKNSLSLLVIIMVFYFLFSLITRQSLRLLEGIFLVALVIVLRRFWPSLFQGEMEKLELKI